MKYMDKFPAIEKLLKERGTISLNELADQLDYKRPYVQFTMLPVYQTQHPEAVLIGDNLVLRSGVTA